MQYGTGHADLISIVATIIETIPINVAIEETKIIDLAAYYSGPQK